MSGRPTALKRAQTMREVLLDYGVPEVSIELQQGRPTRADRWNAIDPVGVMSHHIASRPTPGNPTPGLSLVKYGRADLPGPLANGTAGVDLVYRILTLGLANHPGLGGPLVLSGPLGSYRVPRDGGRPYLWGTEYEGGYTDEVWDRSYVNRRTGRKMTFREFMGRANAALAEAIWLPGVSSRGRYGEISAGADLSTYHVEHKTWAPGRKVDRRGYTTASGRAEVRRFNDKENEMTPAQAQQLQRIEDRLKHLDEELGHFRARERARDAADKKRANQIKKLLRDVPEEIVIAVIDAANTDEPAG